METRAIGWDGLRPAVDRIAPGIDHAANNGADAEPACRPGQADPIPVPHAPQIAEWIQERQVVVETDDFGQERWAALSLNLGDRADRRENPPPTGHS